MKGGVIFSFVFVTSLAAHAGDPLSFDPVGFVKLGNSSDNGKPAVDAFSDVRISIPLESKSLCGKFVSSVRNNVVHLTGDSNWEAGKWSPSAGTTYSIVVTSGLENGLRGLITSSAENSLSVETTTPGNLDQLSTGDKIEIRKAWTLKSFFSSAVIPPGVQVMLFDGTTAGIHLSPSTIAVWSGSSWYYVLGAPSPKPPTADGLILHPGESFILRTGPTPIADLPVFGEVPNANHRITIKKISLGIPQDTTIGYFGPTPEVIGESGLGWNPGDQLIVFDETTQGLNKSAKAILVYSGKTWYPVLGVSGDVHNTFTLKPGVGYVFRQGPLIPPSDKEWADTPSR